MTKKEILNLVRMDNGSEGVVVRVQGGYGIKRKLDDMGVREGVRIKKLNSQMFRGPVVLNVGQCKIAVGYGMASKIFVKAV